MVECLSKFAMSKKQIFIFSLIIHYIVADDVSPSGKAVFQYSLQGYKQLGLVG